MKLRQLRRYQADHFKPRYKDLTRRSWAHYLSRLKGLQRIHYINLFIEDYKCT
jgi:hypothetical protein